MSIDALHASESRRLMQVLVPNIENGGLWFGVDNSLRSVIVARPIRRHFDGPWFNISSVPNVTIIQVWGEFIQAFYGEEEHLAMVYKFWYNMEEHSAARLRDMVSKAKKGERPEWISQIILVHMLN